MLGPTTREWARRPWPGIVVACLPLAGCGGGGGGDGGGAQNVAPVADAGNDRTVVELTTIELRGSAVDANPGDTLTYAWSQTAGTAVTIDNAGSALATFLAPDVASGAPQTLTFRLTATDNAGASGNALVRITVQEPGDVVAISGKAEYEFVPARLNCLGLDYTQIELRPIRQATVQVLDAATDAVLGSDNTDDNGDYAITVNANTAVYVRVRAELKRTGAPGWDVEVRDNTAATALPLAQRPVYALDTGDFDSGDVAQQRDMVARTGWDGTAYASPRAAAPFAILDAVYSAMQLVMTADATTNFPALDAYWSVNNRASEGSGNFDADIAAGDIGTSFYSSGINSLFLLGTADQDTEEFDDHVIVHEWGHYFEDVFSRSDSVGGEHGLGDRLDMRVAFGEGWATALSGMALNSPRYCDTSGPSQASGFQIDIENDTAGRSGWFNEVSVMALLYDLWDEDDDGADTGSVGFGPVYTTMTEGQSVTPAATSIFSFLAEMRAVSPGDTAFIDALGAAYDINGNSAFGDGETNDGANDSPDDVLPVYTDIMPNGVPVKICSNRQYDTSFEGNKLSEYRFLRLAIGTASRYTFDLATDAATVSQLPPGSQSNPDLLYRLDGQIRNAVVDGEPEGLSEDANREMFTSANVLSAGTYSIDVVEFRHQDTGTDPAFPERSCFDFSITPSP